MQIPSVTNTNLITNPSFENNTSGWTTFNSAITRVTSDFYVGTASCQVVTTGTGGVAIYAFTGTVGKQYVAQARVKGTIGDTLFIQMNGLAAGGYVQITADGTWQLLTTLVEVADVASFSVQVGNPASGATFLVDAVQLEQAAQASTYFDGDSGVGYSWTGTAHASTSVYRQFVTLATSNSQAPTYSVLIDWTKALAVGTGFFTIGTSAVGGNDFIPGTQTYPTYYNQYQYTEYNDYLLGASITKNIGQYPYGLFAAQLDITLDNTSLLFLPGYDATIGNYIINGRPTQFAVGYGGESMTLFAGTSIRPQNDLQNRTMLLQCFDGADYLRNFISQAQGPLAVAGSGVYANVRADLIIQDLLQEAGFATNQFVLEQSLQPTNIGYLSPLNQSIGELIQSICESEQGIFFFDENGVGHFWNRQHIALNNTAQWTFDYSQIVNFKLEDTPILNDVVMQAQPRVTQAKQVIWQLTSAVSVPSPTTSTILNNLIVNPSFETNTANWSIAGAATLSRYALDSYGTGSASAQLTSGSYNDYMSQNVPSSTGVSYVAQCRVKGGAGQFATVEVVYGGSIVATFTQTLTGGWDLLTTPSFTPGAGNFTLRIYPHRPQITSGTLSVAVADGVQMTDHKRVQFPLGSFQISAADFANVQENVKISATTHTILVDNIMVNTGTSALTYFDGNTPNSTSYMYGWNGVSNESTSIATPCGSTTITADFQDDYGEMPVTSVDTPAYVTSATSSNYTTNLNDDGSGLAQNSNVAVISTSLTGTSYTVTFTNTYSQPVWITAMSLYGIPAKVTQTINVNYTDPTSITLYGTNPSNNGQQLVIQNNLIQDSSTALANAYNLVSNYSKPYARMTCDVFAVPQLQFGDYVTVHIDDTGLSTTYVIVGITNGISEDGEFSQTLELEVRNIVNYFTINQSQIGGTDVISP